MASLADQMSSNISLANFSRATDLKKRLWFTLGALIVFRLLSYVPLPGVDPTALGLLSQHTQGGVLDFFNTFSGGSLKRMSLTALGVMPYITASIVVQLATSLSPQLAAIKKEGESGRMRLNQYTRYGTVALTAVQGYFIAVGLEALGANQGVQAIVEPGMLFRIGAVDQPRRRHDVPDVAGRADHEPRDRQRRFADHYGRHRRLDADADLQPAAGRAHGIDEHAEHHPDHRRGRRAGAVHLLHGVGAAPHPDPISQAPDAARDAGRSQPPAAQAQHGRRDPADLRLVAAADAADGEPVRRAAMSRARAGGGT